jgi:hypothetical protein
MVAEGIATEMANASSGEGGLLISRLRGRETRAFRAVKRSLKAAVLTATKTVRSDINQTVESETARLQHRTTSAQTSEQSSEQTSEQSWDSAVRDADFMGQLMSLLVASLKDTTENRRSLTEAIAGTVVAPAHSRLVHCG